MIAGFTAPRRSRPHFGALVLALRDGKAWRYIGHVGTGFLARHAGGAARQALAAANAIVAVHGARKGRGGHDLGETASWSPRSSSPNGRRPAKCAIRCSWGCGRTSGPRTSCWKKRSPARGSGNVGRTPAHHFGYRAGGARHAVAADNEARPRAPARRHRDRARELPALHSHHDLAHRQHRSERDPLGSSTGEAMRRPLLIVDGDSFAHRAYHALPKSIRRRGNKGAGAILGFANFLLRFYETEKPRAVLVGWDTYDAPTYRNEALASYQSGRIFDDELIEQLEVLPEFVRPADSRRQRRPVTRPTIFWRPPLPARRSLAARPLSRAATGTLTSWRRSARRSCSPCARER